MFGCQFFDGGTDHVFGGNVCHRDCWVLILRHIDSISVGHSPGLLTQARGSLMGDAPNRGVVWGIGGGAVLTVEVAHFSRHVGG